MNGLPQLDRSDQRLAALPGVARILSSSSDMACERRAAAACRQKPEPIGCGWLSGDVCAIKGCHQAHPAKEHPSNRT